MNTQQYIDSINQRYKLGNATEHTFRGDLQQLLESLLPEIQITNEPKQQYGGMPDYNLLRNDIQIGVVEAKDIGAKDLKGEKANGNKEQFDRYKKAFQNIVFTDYIIFNFYRNEELTESITIGEIINGQIKSKPENFPKFEGLIKDFGLFVGQTIKSPQTLATMMAGQAGLLAINIEGVLNSEEDSSQIRALRGQKEAFNKFLIHGITNKEFADIYAQTIAYGMFAARLHDTTAPTFSRQEAAELIPKSNPFLRSLFGYIAGPDIYEGGRKIVDRLVEIFLACDVAEILKNYGRSTKMEDPIIHFYETFLTEYDPKLRKARGVWYTPAPVVNFIVRAVDDVLKSEFGLSQGLADTSKTTIKVDTQMADKRSATGYKQETKEVHRVQILDPATGTGTFLAEVVKHIHKKFEGQQGIWSSYVEKHLLPRLNGFELLMASYAMAHLQLDLLLTETGFNPTSDQRLKVFLTNSLEAASKDRPDLFMSQWLTEEGIQADVVKRETPVMCIIGNPPYSGISSNNSEWIANLIEDYKYVDGVHFNERKHWLNDDYVKFLRYGQHFIEKNGSGVLVFINPHGFLDNPTFRGMRWNLLKTYDKIYTIDLHGNSKKKETAPDGGVDQNVFDIMQGVSINIFIKTGKKKSNELGKVFHYDLYGKRDLKYDFLSENSLKQIDFKELDYNEPFYFFVPKDDEGRTDYEEGFRVDDIFNAFTSGMVTANDALTIFNSKDELVEETEKILSSDNPFTEFKIKDSRRISKEGRIEDLKSAKAKGEMKINFRPFDVKYMYKFDKNEHWINSPRTEIMKNFYNGENIGLVIARQCADNWKYIFCTKDASDFNLTGTAGRYGSGYIFPLYLYPETHNQTSTEEQPARVPNLNMEIVEKMASGLAMYFSPERPEDTEETNQFYPEDILDYIYAVLHSPAYREKYKEFLKVDFPRVPYPKDGRKFYDLVDLGRQLRELHLLESPIVEQRITKYPIHDEKVVDKPRFVIQNKAQRNEESPLGNVYINETQYFENVPEVAWNFYIGGYQPAQKWLKDRKGRKLEFDDILHYQKIIVALTETDRLMKEVDKIGVV